MTTSLTTIQQPASLPDLVRRAATSLAGAESAAEILDARTLARFARDGLKREAAMLKARSAHGDVIAAVRRSQGDALEIEALADKRLADEYDAAQERGEVQKPGGDRVSNVPDRNNAPTVADIGLSRKEIHEARALRDAEKVEPGVVRRILDEKLAAGEEPTKAALRAGIAAVNGKKPAARSAPALTTEEAAEQEFDPLAARAFVAPKPDYNGLSADERIAELIDHVAALETDIRGYIDEIKTFAPMLASFKRGDTDGIISAQVEEIRVLKERVYSESQAKAEAVAEMNELRRKRDYWMGEAKRLGWRAPTDGKSRPADYDDTFYAATQAEGGRH